MRHEAACRRELPRQVEQIVRDTPGTGAVSQELRDEVGRSDERLKELLYLSSSSAT
jgi:hypothetical protein